MEVIILCGGLGTRLREETEFRPKPMVNIGPRPILWHIMKIYAHYGHTEFILPLGYKGEMIREYFVNYEWMNNDVTLELGKPETLCLHQCHDEAGWRITLADTGPDTLKGGRLKRVEKYIKGDTFKLTYGDGVADIDIDALVAFHKAHGKIVTLTGVGLAQRFGELKVDGNRVSSFQEKPDHAGDSLINGGYMVLDRSIFDYLTSDKDCDLEYGPFERLAQDGELMVRRHDGYWACMDTLRDTELLNRLWNEDRAEWKVW
ncbi:glucose-1-phosphate cytidylyltransferase [Pseudodesulfovibrio aespoeensis]|uniref:glucose-1-phosphate cytidylyltransferase n=1 Tax=Pseudodesulfovibrio aespoeensis TaxID=182210 RepID=UPI002356FB8E|nr:glucose-1-phosphate cytidylyltransferase [Pseudodesulfovibrio aespoeensis]MCG2734522.1 glucose-1-phosphate cytidylyltransferase [Pseudodesulfovibrio aespoeensis]